MSLSQEWAMACDHQWFSPLGMALPRNVDLVWICFPTIFNNMGICTCVGICPPPSPPNVDYTFNSSSISTTFYAHSSHMYQNKNHGNDNIVLPFSLPHTSCHHLNILGFNMVGSIFESCEHRQLTPITLVCLQIEILIKLDSQWWKMMLKMNGMKKHIVSQEKKTC